MSAFKVIRTVITGRDWSPPGVRDPRMARPLRRILLAFLTALLLCLASFACAFAALWDGNAGYLYDTAHAMTLLAITGFGAVVLHSAAAARRIRNRPDDSGSPHVPTRPELTVTASSGTPPMRQC